MPIKSTKCGKLRAVDLFYVENPSKKSFFDKKFSTISTFQNVENTICYKFPKRILVASITFGKCFDATLNKQKIRNDEYTVRILDEKSKRENTDTNGRAKKQVFNSKKETV